jgi:hypothetical protein
MTAEDRIVVLMQYRGLQIGVYLVKSTAFLLECTDSRQCVSVGILRPWFVYNFIVILLELNTLPHQPRTRILDTHDPSQRFVVTYDLESATVEILPKVFNLPYNCGQFFYNCTIILLCFIEAMARKCDGQIFINFPL